MSILPTKVHLALEYFGIRSSSYYHHEAIASYDASDPLKYFTVQRPRANYKGVTDSAGVPLYKVGSEINYLPVQIAFWGLGNYEIWRETKDETALANVQKAADWFLNNQTPEGLWLTPFSSKRFRIGRNHQSAMVQGMGISLLLRAYHIVRDQQMLTAANRALQPYKIEVKKGGVTEFVDGHPIYEEYPCSPPIHVLNGTIYALWGLHDAVKLGGLIEAQELLDRGIQGLLRILSQFDSSTWSWYHIGDGPKNPATILYHKFHVIQLRIMGDITGHREFIELAVRFQRYQDAQFGALRTLPQKVWWLIRTSL